MTRPQFPGQRVEIANAAAFLPTPIAKDPSQIGLLSSLTYMLPLPFLFKNGEDPSVR
jgi:hypothetical protein